MLPNAAGTLGWAFKGQRILEATLAILSGDSAFGLGSVPGTRLLLGGCSSGARGALVSLDYVGEMARRRSAPPPAVDSLATSLSPPLPA